MRFVVVFGQRTIHLVGRHLQELLPFGIDRLTLGVLPAIPRLAGAVKHVLGPQNIGFQEELRIGDTAIDMRLGRKVDHIVYIGLGKNIGYQFGIAYIPSDESYPRVGNLLLDCTQVAGIGELIQNYHINIVSILLQQVFQKVSTNEAGCAGNQIFFHVRQLKNSSQFTTFLRKNTIRVSLCFKVTSKILPYTSIYLSQ